MTMLIEEKIKQATEILEEKGIDIWMTYVRESDTVHDPCLDLILGTNCTWQSAFLLTRSGGRIAVVGSLDVPNIESRGLYGEVIGYVKSIREPLLEVLEREDPQRIGVNYSQGSPLADGLTHGMYLHLREMLEGTPYAERLVSAEGVHFALRGRKTKTELDRIGRAVDLTLEIFERISSEIGPGRSEEEIASLLVDEMKKEGVGPAWDPGHCPAVFTGPQSAGAHAEPTARRIEPGHLVNIDFGVRVDGYCSDLQRTWYVPAAGETVPPVEVLSAFKVLIESIDIAAAELRPGVECWTVDAAARDHIVSSGYDEYPHALGHQIGCLAHDGSGVLCPQWERYGALPFEKVEAGQVYTIEPRITVEGHGIATVEEIAVVTADGCRFLSDRQTELIISGG
ncbi:M24 family metallopeptidase [Thermodesulfobacteriota bacterium]